MLGIGCRDPLGHAVGRDAPVITPGRFEQGVDAERRADYPAAIHYYRHAVRLYASAHQFHFGLARAYSLSGDNRRALRELERARALGGSDSQRAIYQAKLDTLRRLSARHAGH